MWEHKRTSTPSPKWKRENEVRGRKFSKTTMMDWILDAIVFLFKVFIVIFLLVVVAGLIAPIAPLIPIILIVLALGKK